MTTAEKLYKLRTGSGLSQKELADKSGVSQSAINYWENGKRQPRTSQLKKIAKVFDFPLYLLLDDNYELGDIELELKRARPVNSYEMTEPPKLFTGPLSQYNNKDNNIYIDQNLQKLYEVAIEKAIHHEKLTEEEEQVIIGIPGQLRQRDDLYKNSYSFASSEEELDKLLEQRRKQGEKTLLSNYKKLNDIGQIEAQKRISELTEIPRYIKSAVPPQE